MFRVEELEFDKNDIINDYNVYLNCVNKIMVLDGNLEYVLSLLGLSIIFRKFVSFILVL